MMRHYRYHKA